MLLSTTENVNIMLVSWCCVLLLLCIFVLLAFFSSSFFLFTLFAIAVTWQNSIQNGMGLCHRSIYIHLFWCLKMPKIYVRKEIRSSHAKAMGRGVCKCVNCFEIQRLLFLGWLRPTENDVCLCMKLWETDETHAI